MQTIHNSIRSSGGRLTKIKKAIIAILSSGHCLLAKQDLVDQLNAQGVHPDRSTLYRELQFLTRNGVVHKCSIAGVEYYEIPQDHHHHLICMSCNTIVKVLLGNHLQKQEKQLARQNKFTILNHSLEFYGYCHKCQA
jgi:Fur family ferric uptake transcriptional regulator